jgi:hypothetical protein
MKINKHIALSVAVLCTSALLAGINKNPEKEIEAIVVLFNKQVNGHPSMHWEDFSREIALRLRTADHHEAAAIFETLQKETNPKRVGMRLFANIKKMPGAVQDIIKTVMKNILTLEQRFMHSLRNQRRTAEEHEKHISELLVQ